MHISNFSYFRSKVAATDVLNPYALYPHFWLHQISDLSIACSYGYSYTCNSWTCLFYSEAFCTAMNIVIVYEKNLGTILTVHALHTALDTYVVL